MKGMIILGKKVLIIEDEQPIVDILKFNLSKEGYASNVS